MDHRRGHHAHDNCKRGREEVVNGCEEARKYKDRAYGEEPLQVAGVDRDEEAPGNGLGGHRKIHFKLLAARNSRKWLKDQPVRENGS